MTKRLFLVLICMALGWAANAKDGYKIKVQFRDTKDTLLYLCHYYGKGQTVFRDDSLMLKNGGGTFSSNKKIVGGIYILLFPDKSTYLEILLRNGDDFTLDVSRNDFYNTAQFKGNTENPAFYDYQKFLVKYGAAYQAIEAKLKSAKNQSDSTKVYDELKEKGKELTAYRDDIRKKLPQAFMVKLFNAIEEPEIPKELPTLPDGKKDSTFPRNFYKSHYWDKYDFKDDRLIYSPIYERKLDDYFTKLVVPVPDSVQIEADMILKKAENTEEHFKYSLWFLTRWTETSKIMGMDQAFVHLVENYYMKGKATWVDSAQLEKYIKRARDIAPNMIGQPAMDLRMMHHDNSKIVPLSSVKADYTLLIFWSPDCGHCKTEIPKFDSLYHAVLKKYNVKIYAVDSDNEYEKWQKFIKEKNLNDGWIHVYDPNRVTNFRSFYDVYVTPTIYLLDDKKIIRGKRIDHTNLAGLIEWLDKKKNKK